MEPGVGAVAGSGSGGACVSSPPAVGCCSRQPSRIAAEIAERSDIWGPIHKLSLSEMRRQHKRKEVAQMVWLMKLRWRLLATNHVKMIRGQVHPSKNRCPECGIIGDTNSHLLYECESAVAKEAKAKLLEKLGKIMADEAVEQAEREVILRFWNKPMAFEGDEIDMAAKLLEIVNDGADPHAFFYSTSIDQIFEELHLGRRVKKIKKLMGDALSEHQHDIYTQRAKRERKTRRVADTEDTIRRWRTRKSMCCTLTGALTKKSI